MLGPQMVTRMLNASTALGQIDEQLKQVADLIKELPLEDALALYYQAEQAFNGIDEVRKSMLKSFQHLEYTALPEMIRDRKVKSINLEIDGFGKRRFTNNTRFGCTMLDKIRGHEWLRETGNEALITETVNASSLASFAKQYVQEFGRDLPPDIFKVTNTTYLSVTKT